MSLFTSEKELSVVIPFYNESACVRPLLQELHEVLCDLKKDWEVILVNDGSSDDTKERLEEVAESEPRFRVIHFEKNQGQAAALYHGLSLTRGRYVATLDGDGQNSPADLPALLHRLETKGVDMVVGIRKERNDSRLRRLMSQWANRVRARFLGDGMSDSGCALKVFRHEVISSLIPIRTLYSFIPALAKGAGFTIDEYPVQHKPRQAGNSSYGLFIMLWHPLIDMLGIKWFNWRRVCQKEKKNSPSSTSPQWIGGKTSLILALTFLIAAYFWGVGHHGLLEPDEGRYAEISREMLLNGEWLIPTLNGVPHFQKPPLLYWLTAWSYSWKGINETSARLPSVLASLGVLAMTFGMAQRLFGGAKVGLAAVAILASSLEFFALAHMLTPDMVMTFFIMAAIYCLVRLQDRPKKYGWESWGFFLFLGLGFLTKGPMAWVIPLSAYAGLRFSEYKQGQTPTLLPWVRGGLFTLALSLSWFALVTFQHPELWSYFGKDELLNRFLSKSHGRSQPFWFFLPVLLVGLLPWSLVLPELTSHLLQRMKKKVPLSGPSWLLLGWLVPPFILLSLSGSKLSTYVLPLFPALSILLASFFLTSKEWRLKPLFYRGSFLFFGLGFFLVALAQGWIASLPHVAISWWPIALFTLLGALLLVPYRPQLFQLETLGALSLVAWLALTSQLEGLNPVLGRQASVRPLAQTLLLDSNLDHAKVVISRARAHGLAFYLNRLVGQTIRDVDAVLPLEEKEGRFYSMQETLVSALPSTHPLYIVTLQANFEQTFAQAGWEPLAQSGEFILLRKLPKIQRTTSLEPDANQSTPLFPLPSFSLFIKPLEAETPTDS